LKMDTAIEVEEKDYFWHAETIEDVIRLQDTDTSNGLSSGEARRRIDVYGKNQLPEKAKVSFIHRLWEQINNILIFILIVAAVVSSILQEWAELGLICAVVIINVTIGLIQEGKAQAAADAIKDMLTPSAQVIRDSQVQVIDSVRFPAHLCCSFR
jgi:magnesium-transporting ATPase (P-type)